MPPATSQKFNLEKDIISVLQQLQSEKFRSYPEIYSLIKRNDQIRVLNRDGKELVPVERMMETIRSVHFANDHKDWSATYHILNATYSNLPKYKVQDAVRNCEQCKLGAKKVKYEFFK